MRAGVASGLGVRLPEVGFEVGLAVKGITTIGADKGACVCVSVCVFIETAGAGEGSGARDVGGGVGMSAEVYWRGGSGSVIAMAMGYSRRRKQGKENTMYKYFAQELYCKHNQTDKQGHQLQSAEGEGG